MNTRERRGQGEGTLYQRPDRHRRPAGSTQAKCADLMPRPRADTRGDNRADPRSRFIPQGDARDRPRSVARLLGTQDQVPALAAISEGARCLRHMLASNVAGFRLPRCTLVASRLKEATHMLKSERVPLAEQVWNGHN